MASLRRIMWRSSRARAGRRCAISVATAPVPLLLLLLRHAALRQYLDTAVDLLTPAGAAQPAERWSRSWWAFRAGRRARRRGTCCNGARRDKGPVGAFLDGAKQDPTLPEFADFWASFANLPTYSAEALDLTPREVMDLAAYRLDAWVTSLAHFRLDETRRTAIPTAASCSAPMAGWRTFARSRSDASAGYVHAPSLAHATTAAVLRSGYLTHQQWRTARRWRSISPSDRVRLGLHLLDGVRVGPAARGAAGLPAGAIAA